MGDARSETVKLGVAFSRKQILQWIPEVASKQAIRDRLANILYGDVKLPAAVFHDSRLLEMINSPDTNLSDLQPRVKLYPEISVRIVQIARSAIFGHGAEIEGFEQACQRVGMKVIRELVYASQVSKGFANFTAPVDWEQFWTRSILIARLNEQLMTCFVGPKNMGFITGLVHDFGTLILREFFAEQMMEVDEMVAQGVPLPVAEKEVLGFHHAHVAGVLCLKWKFPHQSAMGTYHRYDNFYEIHDQQTGLHAACSLISSRLADSVIVSEGVGYGDSEELYQSGEWVYLKQFYPMGQLDMDVGSEFEAAKTLAHGILISG